MYVCIHGLIYGFKFGYNIYIYIYTYIYFIYTYIWIYGIYTYIWIYGFIDGFIHGIILLIDMTGGNDMG